MTGPDGDRDGRRRENEPVSLRPCGGREVASHEGDDGRHDEHGADALKERPADDQHREVGRERRGRRAAAIDDAADRERPLEADDAADLATEHHEAGHDQRVEGDRRLDAGDRRAHVFGDGGDRDVHHRHVEGHEELAGGEREEDEAGARGRRGGRLRAGSFHSRHQALTPIRPTSVGICPTYRGGPKRGCEPLFRISAAPCSPGRRGAPATIVKFMIESPVRILSGRLLMPFLAFNVHGGNKNQT